MQKTEPKCANLNIALGAISAAEPHTPHHVTCEGGSGGGATPHHITCDGGNGGRATPHHVTCDGGSGGRRRRRCIGICLLLLTAAEPHHTMSRVTAAVAAEASAVQRLFLLLLTLTVAKKR